MDHGGDVVRAMARGLETNQFVNVRTQSIDYTGVRLLVSDFDVIETSHHLPSQCLKE
jgi:hypothetical protein